jgi:hypothetical protein
MNVWLDWKLYWIKRRVIDSYTKTQYYSPYHKINLTNMILQSNLFPNKKCKKNHLWKLSIKLNWDLWRNLEKIKVRLILLKMLLETLIKNWLCLQNKRSIFRIGILSEKQSILSYLSPWSLISFLSHFQFSKVRNKFPLSVTK